MKKILKNVPFLVIAILIGVTAVYAGNINPTGTPGKTMKTLSDLYQLVDTGANTPSVVFATPPSVNPSGTMVSIGDTYDLLKTNINSINSNSSKILTGTSFFGIDGTMIDNGAVTITPGTTDQVIAQGYHNGEGIVSGDSELVSSNIKSGATLFGVDGSTSVVDTADANATEDDILTDKTAYVNGVKITGVASAGSSDPTWSSSEASSYDCSWFTDMIDSTQPGLTSAQICAANPHCSWNVGTLQCDGGLQLNQFMTWYAGNGACYNSTEGGQTIGTWRLPTYLELIKSFVEGTHPSFKDEGYWSSGVHPHSSGGAYVLATDVGNLSAVTKQSEFLSRCVH